MGDIGLLRGKKANKRLKEYHCDKCDYTTSDSSHWIRHLKTRKHNDNKMITNDKEGNDMITNKEWICNCGKKYKYHSGYCRHKKACKWEDSDKIKETLPVRENNEMMEMIKDLMSQNQELMAKYTEVATENKELVIEIKELATDNKELADELVSTLKDENSTLKDQNKNLQNNLNETIPRVGNNNNSITNNNNFDVNVFLEDKCKDAMHIQEFGKLLNDTTTVEDVDTYEKNAGTAIGEIMKRELLKLAQIARPLHTYKKEWFVKDRENGWEKDEKGNFVETIRSAVMGSLNYKCHNEKYGYEDPSDLSVRHARSMQNILKQITDERLRNAAKRSIRKICTIK